MQEGRCLLRARRLVLFGNTSVVKPPVSHIPANQEERGDLMRAVGGLHETCWRACTEDGVALRTAAYGP